MRLELTFYLTNTFSFYLEPKAPEDIGHSDMNFLGYPEMWPFQFSQVLKDKPIKMNKKDDKEFADDTYIPLYTFALPVEVRLFLFF